MADQSDVETALVALASAALYPQGTAAASVCNQPCRIYRGWPNPVALDVDLAGGRVNVTVFPVDGTFRNTTRSSGEWLTDPPAPTLTVAVADDTVTFAGTADPGQLAGIAVAGQTYVYRTSAADTPALVAAYLAAMVRADRIAQLTATTITIPGASGVIARVVPDAPALLVSRRQSQRFRLSCWCSDPDTRDTVASAIDVSLSGLSFIPLADGSQGRLVFSGGSTLDQSQDAALYRRDLVYEVEYPTTVATVQPTMLFGVGGLNSVPFIG